MQPPFLLIMAGGVGSRFWPASRQDLPKQFLDILGTGKSLIQMTCDRFLSWIPEENIFIITNEKYRSLVSEHLPYLKQDQIIGEPSHNNTAPCVAYASLKLSKLDPQAVCIVAPSDHVILKESAFEKRMKTAAQFAFENDALLTLGLEPSRADTGYGYIDYDKTSKVDDGIFKVRQFKEKPDLETANTYIEAGHFLWNSGMFIWRIDRILKAFDLHANSIYSLLSKGIDTLNTTAEKDFVNEHYPQTEKISIDYAIMEKAENVYTLPADIGWSDLGTWVSLFDKQAKTKKENITLGNQILLEECHGCMVKNLDGQLIVAKGLEDYIIIQDEKSVLIFPKASEQEIKQITAKIKEKGWTEFL
ncbi:MAG: mannose-1-phosphate guanylyltransferase [Saprospiraceae bacterium]|nr:mannose-1-phosphate guanylyltransferase [Saprospiraceae bacterium]